MIKEEEGDADLLAPIESPVVFMSGMGSSARSSGKYEGFGNSAKDREGKCTKSALLFNFHSIGKGFDKICEDDCDSRHSNR